MLIANLQSITDSNHYRNNWELAKAIACMAARQCGKHCSVYSIQEISVNKTHSSDCKKQKSLPTQ